MGAEHCDGEPKDCRDVGRCKARHSIGSSVQKGRQRLGGMSLGLAEVEDTPRSSQDGAKVRVATATKPNDFTTDAVFLRGKFKADKGRSEEVIGGGRGRGKGKVAKEKTDIPQLERLAGRDRARVLARAKQEEKREADHVGTC